MTTQQTLTYPFSVLPEFGSTLQVADGVRWFRLPLPFALDHINIWLLDDHNGLAIIDSGFGSDENKIYWETLLSNQKDCTLSQIIVTHFHPDHLGLANWLASRNNTPIQITLSEYLNGHAMWNQLPGYTVSEMVAFFRSHGLDTERLHAFEIRGNHYRQGVPSLPHHFRRLLDNESIRIGKNTWRIITGYGHSPEHASLYSESLGILISGDMLLPRISTNISVHASTPDDDPLKRFLDSLSRFRSLPDKTLVLPSHGRPFYGIHARIDALIAHHHERCAILMAACEKPRTASEVLDILFERKLDTHQLMFAMGEAIAHLNYLTTQGKLNQIKNDNLIFYVKNQ